MVWKKRFSRFVENIKRDLIKQKATQTPSREAEKKNLLKTNDTDREEQDTGRVAILCWELSLYKS